MGLGLLGIPSLSVEAYEKNNLNKSTTKQQLFAVPGGGWSSITVKVDYFEYYVPSGSSNKFTSRAAMVVYSTAAATSTPYFILGNVKHSNDKSFSKWNSVSMMYDGSKWDVGFGRENTESVTYTSTTSVTGKLSFIVGCDGGIPAVATESIDMALKTK